MNKFKKSLKKAEKFLIEGQYDYAIEQYKICLNYNQRNVRIWNNIAYAYNKKNRYYEAIEAAERALDIEKESECALNNLFFAYDQLERYDKEIILLKKYLKLNPNLNKFGNSVYHTFFLSSN